MMIPSENYGDIDGEVYVTETEERQTTIYAGDMEPTPTTKMIMVFAVAAVVAYVVARIIWR